MLPIEKMDKDRTNIKTGIRFPIMNSEVQGKNDHRLVFVMSMMSLFVVIERTLILVLFSDYSSHLRQWPLFSTSVSHLRPLLIHFSNVLSVSCLTPALDTQF